METVGTTQAASLLGISTARLRLLLNQGRVKGAYKKGRFWIIPLYNDMPKIAPGTRGPEPTWYKKGRTAKTCIHINRRAIDHNRDYGTRDPVIKVKQGRHDLYCHEVLIKGSCRIIYSPDHPNNSGARLWIEVDPQIQILTKSFSLETMQLPVMSEVS
ncbi:MAG: helix-turn-helix domain-containing protein [Microcoleaceae cyanobacterium MO_207.B10]|nr:helix-turn-helix domain-containing protein [Microcoleaceae cyanobacterium MO_207.B10]